MKRLLALAVLGCIAASAPLLAGDPPSPSSAQRWRSMDGCSKESFRKFPDYTAEASAKRDAFLQECLKSQNLPPRARESSGTADAARQK